MNNYRYSNEPKPGQRFALGILFSEVIPPTLPDNIPYQEAFVQAARERQQRQRMLPPPSPTPALELPAPPARPLPMLPPPPLPPSNDERVTALYNEIEALEHISGHISVRRIQLCVAQHYKCPMRDMLSPRRANNVAWPRQVAMALCRTLTARSLPEIGRRFDGRDHSTVMHAIRKVDHLCATDERVRAEVEELAAKLNPPPQEGTP